MDLSSPNYTPSMITRNGDGVNHHTEQGAEVAGDGDIFGATLRTIDLAQQRLVCGQLDRMSPHEKEMSLKCSQEISESIRRVIG